MRANEFYFFEAPDFPGFVAKYFLEVPTMHGGVNVMIVKDCFDQKEGQGWIRAYIEKMRTCKHEWPETGYKCGRCGGIFYLRHAPYRPVEGFGDADDN